MNAYFFEKIRDPNTMGQDALLKRLFPQHESEPKIGLHSSPEEIATIVADRILRVMEQNVPRQQTNSTY